MQRDKRKMGPASTLTEYELKVLRNAEKRVWSNMERALDRIVLVMPCAKKKKQLENWSRNNKLRMELERELHQATGYRRTVTPFGGVLIE